MEVKKSPKASLENKRLLFAEIGFILSLLLVWGAFSYTSREKKTRSFAGLKYFISQVQTKRKKTNRTSDMM